MIVEFKSNAPRRRLRPGSLFHRRTGDARSGEVEEYEWGGLRYRFSRAEHRELFKSNPEHYVPQFGNFCAMALSKGELVEADPENLADQRRQALRFRQGARIGAFPEGSCRKHHQGEPESNVASEALAVDCPGGGM